MNFPSSVKGKVGRKWIRWLCFGAKRMIEKMEQGEKRAAPAPSFQPRRAVFLLLLIKAIIMLRRRLLRRFLIHRRRSYFTGKARKLACQQIFLHFSHLGGDLN